MFIYMYIYLSSVVNGVTSIHVILILTAPQDTMGRDGVGAIIFTRLSDILIAASRQLGVEITIGDGIDRFGMDYGFQCTN